MNEAKDEAFRSWLQRCGLVESSIRTAISRLHRIESEYGDLDKRYERDRLEGLIEEFTYSVADERSGALNRSRITIDGNLRTGLASLKKTVRRYQVFRS